MILKAVKTKNGKEYKRFQMRGSQDSNDYVSNQNETTITQLHWANEMMRREIWTLKEKLSKYESVDRTPEFYYQKPSVY